MISYRVNRLGIIWFAEVRIIGFISVIWFIREVTIFIEFIGVIKVIVVTEVWELKVYW